MLHKLTISNKPPAEPALDHAHLQQLGLAHVRRLARQVWTDHNVHDPGITILELLCYALTDLAYRASFPIEDLLADAAGDMEELKTQLPTAATVLPSRPLTELDYRKLLIDLPGVKNAWIQPAERKVYIDVAAGRVSAKRPDARGAREVSLRGLYEVRIELMEEVTTKPACEEVLARVRRRLHENRNLCEDFVDIAVVERQRFVVCAELDIDSGAPPEEVQANILFGIQQHLGPPVKSYSLGEMLERPGPDGRPRSVEEIFDGPLLEHGFIDAADLDAADLPDEIRLSDLICLVMDVGGVTAVRDMVFRPRDARNTATDRWRVPVLPGRRPTLDVERSRIVLYRRGAPVEVDLAEVTRRYDALMAEVRAQQETKRVDSDLPIPAGTFRDPGRYRSFQEHFPEIYGLGEQGLPGGATLERKAQALQLKAYLLFFDQILADDCARLAKVRELFSADQGLGAMYAHQTVRFPEWERIYKDPGLFEPGRPEAEELAAMIDGGLESREALVDRRSRMLDHLLARFGERFHDQASVMMSALGATPEGLLAAKCELLRGCPALSAARGLGYDRTKGEPWSTDNVSGLERRLAKVLGMPEGRRRDPGTTSAEEGGEEGMLLVENILLRLPRADGPGIPVCDDPGCPDCADPYSYRVYILLPAEAGRFRNMEFRRFAEGVIRRETPAHVVPRVCWVFGERMSHVDRAYREWLSARAARALDREEKLRTLLQVLCGARNTSQGRSVRPCACDDDRTPKFILSRTRLGGVRDDEDDEG